MQRYREIQHLADDDTSRDHTEHGTELWEIAWIARRPEPMYRVSDRGRLRVETRWTHSKIDLTPEACSLEAGGENDWRWETAPTVGRGKPSLARLCRCVSSPRHLARAAGHATRVCCEVWYTLAQKGATRTDSRTEERAHPPPCRHSITARGLSACHDINEISLFSLVSRFRFYPTIITIEEEEAYFFRSLRIFAKFVSLTETSMQYEKEETLYRWPLTLERRVQFFFLLHRMIPFFFPRPLIIDYRSLFYSTSSFSSRFEVPPYCCINWPNKCAGKCALFTVPLL